MRSRHVLVALALFPASSLAAQVAPPTRDSLDAVTLRGRMLAAYDYAAWHATDAVVAHRPGAGEVTGYIAQPRDGVWVVSFGRMSDDGQAYLVAYEARQDATKPDSFVVTHHTPPRAGSAAVERAARALDVARAARFASAGSFTKRCWSSAHLPTRRTRSRRDSRAPSSTTFQRTLTCSTSSSASRGYLSTSSPTRSCTGSRSMAS